MSLLKISVASGLIFLGLSQISVASSPFVLEKDYTNFAWGYEHKGCYLDELGNIYQYENTPLSKKPLTKIGIVKISDLTDILGLAADLKGLTLDEKHGGFDGGHTVWTIINFGESIDLKVSGDTIGKLKSASADKIIKFIDDACSQKK